MASSSISSSTREGLRSKNKTFHLTPLLAALLLVYPALPIQPAHAQEPPANTLPDLGLPNERPDTTLIPKANGVTLDRRFDGKHLVISPEYSNQTGLSLGGAFAFPFGNNAAGGLVFSGGANKKELLFNAGFQLGDNQRLVFSFGQQRQNLDFGFITGTEKTELTQNSGALSYQRYLGQGALNAIEFNAYLADTPSRDLADKTYTRDTAALYELWNAPRRVAGGRISGLQGRLAFTPLPGGTLKLGAGGERQEYDYLGGKQGTSRTTASAEWSQQLENGYQIKAGADAATQNRYTLGMTRPFGDSGQFGASLTTIRGRDGAPNDNQLKLSWSYAIGGRRVAPSTPNISARSAAPAWGNLLDQVAQRPGFLPSQVVAMLDNTVVPVRLIAVNKAALPANASVNTGTGVVSIPLAVAITSIASVTLNGASFSNSGQFALAGNSLTIDPNQITQPAVGVIDTYVVTVNNAGGGTTLVTVVVSHGSVQIDSITTAAGDITAPVTTAAPAVSGTSDTATTLTATLNENGTGYYLVLPAADAAPSIAAVQAGTAFAMSANTPASASISGLTPVTSYRIYFVAKDAVNNVQAAVQSVEVSTTATLLAVADSSTTPFNTAKSGIDVLANDKNNSGAAFALTGVLSNSSGGTFTVNGGKIDFTPTNGFSGAASVTYEIADASNNKATGLLTVTVGVDPTVPVAVADSASTPFNTAKAGIDVLANDSNSGGAAPALTGVLSNQVGGTFTVNAGKIDFTPTNGFSGAASVTYEIVDADGSNNKATGVLTVTVAAYVPPAPPADTTAPTTSAGPSVSGTTDTATTLSVTINENGTGYYLVQAAAAAAPSVAAVQAGTAFAMTANVAATPAISGLTAATAYKIYFVAKDAAGNVQAAVQSVAVTTSPAAAAPSASAVSIGGTVQAGQTLTGSYTYADANNDPQGASTFRWLRNGAAIAGATASTYSLVAADAGSTVTFEVTPVATVAPTTGTPVVSAATAAVTLPAGYVSQGGLTWMPNNVVNPPNGWDTWANADAYCSGTTLLGQTGWRLPTTAELSALLNSGAMNAQGWALNFTWSSTPHGVGRHESVSLVHGGVGWYGDTDVNYVTCVR